MNIFSKISTFLSRIVDVITQGNLERVRILKEFNTLFKQAFLQGEIDRLCTVITSMGNPKFTHSLSSIYLRSGFKITIENDEDLSENNFWEIAKYVLDSAPFIRQLMALGYDTLIIVGKTNTAGIQISLKQVVDLQKFMLEQAK
ncbi:hypothetical protein [Emticicia fluvialis]|uniref:hypothetical protein n=1 Tax=Emticicia fluvialis TaxID=2974474 RepID=UPI0021655A5E|nr:hypothetical protein [Emticicia fluvialis]